MILPDVKLYACISRSIAIGNGRELSIMKCENGKLMKTKTLSKQFQGNRGGSRGGLGGQMTRAPFSLKMMTSFRKNELLS